ncbi:MAG: InlB B-repeat-containing protein, partial [Oscillospiraceae bacterium]|nr:InlB B-repeat-containing protein [Oscillospiraceae bacterium]
MKRSICSLLLILCLLAQLWIPATASGSMTTSTDGKAFINEHQGGTSYSLSAAEKEVNSFKSKYGLSLKQSQFDALVDFVVAYPNHNILSSNYKIERVISGGNYTDAELASAFTSWVKGSDGEVSSKNLNRRIREAKLFLYGSYDGNCNANFRYVLFNPNGGDLVENSVICYPYNKPYNNLPVAENGSKYFAGWYTLAGSEGVHIYNSTYVDSNRTLYAHWSDNEVPDPNTGSSGGTGNFDYPDLKVSESLIAFIKAHEGFSSYRYWDYGQYTIGYGTRWDSELYPDGTITEEEADYELRKELAKFEAEVDRLLKKGTVSHNQHQYDAIISFTFNLGSQWMSSSNRIYQYILFGHPSELEFLDAMGSWASAGGQVIRNLMQRRMDEADMYLNGNYQRDSKTYFGMHLTVNTSDKTALIDKSGKSYAMFYAKAGQPIGTMPKATRSGYTFLGWFDGNGVQYTKDTIAPATVSTLRAKWKEGEPEPPVTEPPVEIPNETGFTDIPANAWYIPY